MPNFFSMGYYLTFSKEPLPALSVKELNVFLRKYLDDHFMLEFIKDGEIAMKKSAEKHDEAKRLVIEELKKAIVLFENTQDYTTIDKEIDALIAKVNASIDPLEIHKDSIAYTFASSIRAAVQVCLNAKKGNIKAISAYEKQKKKYDAYAARKGRNPEWKLTPPAVIDMGVARENVRKVLSRLLAHYEEILATRAGRDFNAEMGIHSQELAGVTSPSSEYFPSASMLPHRNASQNPVRSCGPARTTLPAQLSGSSSAFREEKCGN
jgi:hypothetical protein